MKITYKPVDPASRRITKALVRGSLIVAIALTSLLIIYDILHESLFRLRVCIGLVTIAYLIYTNFISRKGNITLANWLLIILYETLAATVLIHWGLNSAVGILTASFTILLPGILMTPRAISIVTSLTFSLIIITYLVHTTGLVTPTLYVPLKPSSLLDAVAYISILGIFSLVSWISSDQSARSLSRALSAEERLKKQKEFLAIELQKESQKLRESQLTQVHQLHKFATIGQSTVAVLHELSNHLSVLNLDIDDLKQHHKHSKAISRAEDGMKHINRMIRNARLQLDNYSKVQRFNCKHTINKTIKDLAPKFKRCQVLLVSDFSAFNQNVYLNGDPLSLMQITTILLNNALDACTFQKEGKVILQASVDSPHNTLTIQIRDNGPGLNDSIKASLFQPHQSTKASGLGVGLYIAKHLTESKFKGDLYLMPSKTGAIFELKIPLTQ